MSAFTVCWKEEDGIAAIHFHSLILANVLEHFGAGEILLTSEVKHQQDLNKILFLLHYLSCEEKGREAGYMEYKIIMLMLLG